MSKPGLTIGFIGAGGSATHYLAGCVHSGLVRQAVLAEPDEEARGPLRRRFGLIKADHAEWAPLLSDPEVQLVVVCAPLAERCEAARRALEAGKHVILDAPPARTAAELQELAGLAEARGRRLLCALSHLHMPAHLKLDELLQKEPLPQPLLALAIQTVAPSAKAEEDLLAGAYLAVAALQHVLGPTRCVAGALMEAQSLALTLLIGEDVPVQISVALGRPEERPQGERRIITAERFVLVRDNPEDELPLIVGHGEEAYPVKVKAPPDVYEYAAVHMMGHLLDCVAHDRPEQTTLPEALAATATLEAALQAAARRCSVDVSPVSASASPASP